jgi:LPS sulfotransferase NodH
VPASHFVILGHPRSGSTLLVQSLRAYEGILAYGELFQDEPDARRRAFRGAHVYYETDADGAAFLSDTIFHDDGDADTVAVGFKLFYTQARARGARSAWRYLLGRTDLCVIHLTRDNLLDAFVSLREAEASGRWHVGLGETPPAGAAIHVDPGDCLRFLDCVSAHRAWVRRAFQSHALLELSYERHLAADFDRTMAQVQGFLGVPPKPLPILSRKQSSGPLETRVSNYHELKDRLRLTIHRAD